MTALTVITPVYNEAEVIASFYFELREVLENLAQRYDWTIIFVIDRSEDNTVEIVRKIAESDPNVKAVVMSSRFGHQMALIAGMDHCDADIVVMMDSDLQHPPSLIAQLIDHYEQGYDVVYTLREDTQDINYFKRTSSRLFYRVINRISDTPINESAADFRLISRRVLQVFQTQIRERNQFLRGLFGWVGFKSIGVTFRVQRRRSGKSKYSISRMIRFGLYGVISFSKSPLQAAAVVGFIFAFFGFAIAMVVILQFLVVGNTPSGWSALAILVSIFSGTQLIFLGVVGEYIGAIFDEVKGRPHYIVEERINFQTGALKQ